MKATTEAILAAILFGICFWHSNMKTIKTGILLAFGLAIGFAILVVLVVILGL